MFNDLFAATSHALQNGLTNIPISSAMDNTETWQQQLLQSGQPGLQDIGREIGNLQSLLTSGSLNPQDIGQSLSLLSSQTLQAANTTDDTELKGNLRNLGDSLLRASTQLLEAAQSKSKK